MEFTRLSVLALFCLALVGTEASQATEDYWQSIWPNTPMPEALWDLLLPYNKTDTPIKAEEEAQYWTVFFQHELYPGKKMSMGFHNKHLEGKTSQPFGVKVWAKEEGQPFEKTRKLGKKARNEGERGHDFDQALHGDVCKSKPAIGEDKHCANSLESMMEFAVSRFGKNIHPVTSSFAPNQDQYAVEEVKKIGESAVMCHRLNYDEVVFYCHVIHASTTYMVPMVAPDGTAANALTICHHDTRGMNPETLYEMLKVKPGTVPVCHFVGNKGVAWVPNFVSAAESSDHPCVV